MLHAADDLNHKLATALSAPVNPWGDPFRNTLGLLRFFIERLQTEEGWATADITVFIDTNPSFSEYTQLALCEWRAARQPAHVCTADPAGRIMARAAPPCRHHGQAGRACQRR